MFLVCSEEGESRMETKQPKGRFVTRAAGPVAILPFSPVPAEDLAAVERTVTRNFGAPTWRFAETAPAACFDAARGQYDADLFLDELFKRLPDSALCVIGVTNADMFAAGRTFVFGYAHLRDGVAVISLARLREEWHGRIASKEKLQSRLHRVIAHELGHVGGNQHCESNDCVMKSISGVDSLDVTPPSFCGACLEKARRAFVISPTSAEGRFRRAGAFLRRKYPAKAAVAYRDAVRLNPKNAHYRNDLGVALLAAADKRGARDEFRRAAELDQTNFPHPHYNLGIVTREDDGDAIAAEQYFSEGLKRDRDPIVAHRYLGQIYDTLFGDTERALRHYQAYLDLGGSDPEISIRVWVLILARPR